MPNRFLHGGRKVLQVLQGRPMNNLLYAVMTIFSEWFNVCSQQFVGTMVPLAPTWLGACGQ